MLKYTTRFKGENKKLSIDAKNRALADLMAMGWNVNDAFIAVGLYNATFSDEYNKNQIKQITEDEKFLEYMQKKERALTRGFKSVPSSISESVDKKNMSYRTKDEVLNGLISELPNLRGKDKADVLMKIADLQQMKKEESIEEDNTVHFYLPISCHDCSLYIKAKERERSRKNCST